MIDCLATPPPCTPAGRRPGDADPAGNRGRVGVRHRQAALGHRPDHLRPRLRQHRRRSQLRDHLHRRRRGHPALPRLPDRAARGALDVPRDQLPADLRRAADRRTELDDVHRQDQPAHAAARGPQGASSTASRATRTRWRCCPSAVSALSTFYQDSLDPFDADDGRALDRPPAGQAADDRGVRLQEVDRPAVPLPGQLARPGRELPAHDVRLPGRALRGRPGDRHARWTCC